MTQQLLSRDVRERPALIVPIAWLAFAYALLLCVCGGLEIAGLMPMRVSVQLLGSGLEVMGPAPFFLYALLLVAGGVGLLRAKNWGRRLMIAISAAGVVLLVPHISSAVIDERWFAMSVDGVQILLQVAVASYLLRESGWFAR